MIKIQVIFNNLALMCNNEQRMNLGLTGSLGETEKRNITKK